MQVLMFAFSSYTFTDVLVMLIGEKCYCVVLDVKMKHKTHTKLCSSFSGIVGSGCCFLLKNPLLKDTFLRHINTDSISKYVKGT